MTSFLGFLVVNIQRDQISLNFQILIHANEITTSDLHSTKRPRNRLQFEGNRYKAKKRAELQNKIKMDKENRENKKKTKNKDKKTKKKKAKKGKKSKSKKSAKK